MNAPTTSPAHAYADAQAAIASLKSAIYSVLLDIAPGDLSNAEIGKTLGIYGGHKGHVGHISRTLLEMMQSEEVVVQHADTKRWRLKSLPSRTAQ